MKHKLKAVNGWVIVRRKPPETSIKGMMILLSGDDFENRECEVISVSTPRNMKTGAKSKEGFAHVSPGDTVICLTFDTQPLDAAKELLYIDHEDILMVLPKKANTNRYQNVTH